MHGTVPRRRHFGITMLNVFEPLLTVVVIPDCMGSRISPERCRCPWADLLVLAPSRFHSGADGRIYRDLDLSHRGVVHHISTIIANRSLCGPVGPGDDDQCSVYRFGAVSYRSLQRRARSRGAVRIWRGGNTSRRHTADRGQQPELSEPNVHDIDALGRVLMNGNNPIQKTDRGRRSFVHGRERIGRR